MSETRTRSVAKAASWRVLATPTTIAIVLLFTGQIELALAVGGVEVVAKLLMFYVHERAWQRIGWGAGAGANGAASRNALRSTPAPSAPESAPPD